MINGRSLVSYKQKVVEPERYKHIPKEDLELIFDEAKFRGRNQESVRTSDIRNVAILTLSYRYGLRNSEMRALKLSDVDLADKSIFIRRLKGSVSKRYPMPKDVIEVLEAWMYIRFEYKPKCNNLFITWKGEPLGTAAANMLIKRLAEKLGMQSKHYRFHSLRHSIAVHMLEARIGIERVQDLLGHKAITSTLVYAKIYDQAREDYIDEMSDSENIVKISENLTKPLVLVR